MGTQRCVSSERLLAVRPTSSRISVPDSGAQAAPTYSVGQVALVRFSRSLIQGILVVSTVLYNPS